MGEKVGVVGSNFTRTVSGVPVSIPPARMKMYLNQEIQGITMVPPLLVLQQPSPRSPKLNSQRLKFCSTSRYSGCVPHLADDMVETCQSRSRTPLHTPPFVPQ